MIHLFLNMRHFLCTWSNGRLLPLFRRTTPPISEQFQNTLESFGFIHTASSYGFSSTGHITHLFIYGMSFASFGVLTNFESKIRDIVDNAPHNDVGMIHFCRKGYEKMVEQPAKRKTKNLSTWWDRGPSGPVEEWETRVPEEEIARRQNRWRSTPNPTNKPAKNSTP